MRISAAQPLALRLRDRAERGNVSGSRPGAGALAHGERASARIWPALLVCLALAGLTFLLPSTPTYDPWAWIMWGREIGQLDLVTTGGPSWKPLPVMFTTVFSLFGSEVAPYLWLWVARAGGMFALVMAFRLTRRLTGSGPAGVIAGLTACAFLITSYQFARDAALGNSEPLLAAIALWAFQCHLDGRRDHALYLGFAVALLRPEAWPFIGAYGLWLWFREPELRLRVVAVGVLIPALWFGPELWGSGDAFRASTRANDPNAGSAAFADSPGLEVAYRFHERTIWPIELGALIAAMYAGALFVRERSQRTTLWLLGAGLGWLALVAIMTELGYAGNQRYLIVTTAAICVLGGVGFGRIFEGLRVGVARLTDRPKAGLVAASAVFGLGLVALTPVIKDKVDNTEVTAGKLEYEASLWGNLPEAIEKAGGRDRLLRCGSVYSGPFQTQMMAYELGVHGVDVQALVPTVPPGLAFQTHTVRDGPLVTDVTDDRFRTVATNSRWRVLTAPRSDARGRDCPAAGPDAPRVGPRDVTPKLVSSR
ncbi:MAG: hypothetical protein M3370_06555 [Actinomycetota bacterium]|nr:hypothetical protein [Actinomycetota bacterium]